MRINFVKNHSGLKGKKVLLRVDFNVPLRKGKIISDYKIVSSLSTIEYLRKQGAKIIIMSHLGRPKGYERALSLKPIVQHMEFLLGEKCTFIQVQKLKNGWKDVKLIINQLVNGEIAVLENIRFFEEEENNSKRFAKILAGLGDIFVFDAFGVSHRKAASVCGVSQFLPTFAGILLNEELQAFSRVLEKPRHPFVVLLGGIKIETKIPVIKQFLSIADYILLGGGIANTYLSALGKHVGNSVIDQSFKKEIIFFSKYKKIILPEDVIVGKQNGKGKVRSVSVDTLDIAATEGIYDIGPKTIKKYSNYIKKSSMLVWNGAMGYFEQSPYERGTFALARTIAQQSKGRTFGVCGGGETEEILQKLHLTNKIDLVSTGGGAMLEFLGGKKLPGIEVVLSKNKF